MSWLNCKVFCGKQEATYSVRNQESPTKLFCVFSNPVKISKLIVDGVECKVESFSQENNAYKIVLNQPKKGKSDDDKSAERPSSS